MFRRRKKNPEEDKAKRLKPSRSSYREALQLASYLRPYKGTFIPAILALFLTAGLSLAFPYFMGQLIGQGTSSGQAPTPEAMTASIDQIAMTLAAILLVQATIAFFRIRLFAVAGESALADMRRDLYGHLIRLPVPYFGEHRVGELSSRIASDLTLIRETFLQTFPQLVRHSVMLVGGLVFIFISSAKLAFFMLACLPVVLLLVALFGRKVRTYSKEAQDQLASSQVVVEETLQGITSVKAFHNETHETHRYGAALDRFLATTMRGASVRAAFVAFIIFILMGTITAVVWFGVKMLATGAISQEQLYQFILFSIFVGASMGSLPEVISQIQKAVGATETVRDLLNENVEGRDYPTTADGLPARLKGELTLRDLHFAYPSRPDLPVLKGIKLEARPGQRIALVGGSGTGKTTITNLLLQFYAPESGSILFDGQPATSYPLEYLRSQMALVPQEVLLFGGTIRENIAYGRPGASAAEIEEAARRAQAESFIHSFPEGYDTLVGDRGIKLSGGQRQRIAIARALLADPAILILDEATSALDSESERLVQQALEELMIGRTSIIVAHRLSTIRDADQILVLQNGKVAESGSHEELVKDPEGLYRMLSKLQFGL